MIMKANAPVIPALVDLGRLVNSARKAAGYAPAELARRSALSRETIYAIERGHQRSRRSTLSALALGIDPDHHRELLAELVAAAGGEDQLARDGNWPSYRRRRLTQGILRGDVPLPSKITAAIRLHRAADAADREADRLSGEGASASDLERTAELMDEAAALRSGAGPLAFADEEAIGRRLTLSYLSALVRSRAVPVVCDHTVNRT